MPLENPHGRLQVAQTAGRGFEVRLQPVLHVVELLVPRRLLVALCTEKLVRRPEAVRAHDPVELGGELLRAREQPPLVHRCGYRNVVLSLDPAIGEPADAVADVEVEVV